MSADQKAATLLASGRVTILRAGADGRMLAEAVGDHGTHKVRRTAGGRWACDCPASYYGQKCSHITAVSLVSGDSQDGWAR